MKHYEVTDKTIAQEIIAERNRLNDIKNKFISTSEHFGINGCQIKGVGFYDNLNDVVCRGFSVNDQASQRFKFKLAHGGKTLLPKKKYEQEVQDLLGGLNFSETYSMVDTWNKLVKFSINFDHESSQFNRDGVNGYFVKDGRVFVAISANHEEANLNVSALKEIKESEYLAEQGE